MAKRKKMFDNNIRDDTKEHDTLISIETVTAIASKQALDDFGVKLQPKVHAWSPDSTKILFPFCSDGEENYEKILLFVYDTNNQTVAHQLKTESDTIRALSWSPNGNLFAVLLDETCNIYNAVTGSLDRTIEYYDIHRHMDLVWSRDGSTLGLPTSDSLYIYEVATGKELRHVHFGGDHDYGYPQVAAYSPDGKYLAIGDSRNGISIFFTSTFKCFKVAKILNYPTLMDFITPVSASDDMENFSTVVGMSEERLDLKKMNESISTGGKGLGKGGAKKHRRVIHSNVVLEDDGIMSLAWSSDGKLLAAGGPTGGVYVWNMDSGKIKFNSVEIEWSYCRDETQFGELLKSNRGAYEVKSSQKKYYREGEKDYREVKVPTINNRSNHLEDDSYRTAPSSLVFSKQNDALYSSNGHVKVWDIASGVSRPKYFAHAYCTVSPDCSAVAGFYRDEDYDINVKSGICESDNDYIKLCFWPLIIKKDEEDKKRSGGSSSSSSSGSKCTGSKKRKG